MGRIELYDNYKHWYHAVDPKHYGVVWVFADPHFGEKNVHWWPEPYEIVDKINSTVGKKDTIIFLGDIGDPKYIKDIKGYKVLFTGNHDKGVSNYKKKFIATAYIDGYLGEYFGWKDTKEEVEEYITEYNLEHTPIKFEIKDNGLFDEVYDGPQFINKKICLSHEPIKLGFGLNIHGHTHSQCRSGSLGEWSSEGWATYNAVCDLHSFKPLRLDEVVNKYKVIDLHRKTINKAGGVVWVHY